MSCMCVCGGVCVCVSRLCVRWWWWWWCGGGGLLIELHVRGRARVCVCVRVSVVCSSVCGFWGLLCLLTL